MAAFFLRKTIQQNKDHVPHKVLIERWFGRFTLQVCNLGQWEKQPIN